MKTTKMLATLTKEFGAVGIGQGVHVIGYTAEFMKDNVTIEDAELGETSPCGVGGTSEKKAIRNLFNQIINSKAVNIHSASGRLQKTCKWDRKNQRFVAAA